MKKVHIFTAYAYIYLHVFLCDKIIQQKRVFRSCSLAQATSQTNKLRRCRMGKRFMYQGMFEDCV